MIKSHALMSENEKRFICSALSGGGSTSDANGRKSRLRMDGRTWLTDKEYGSHDAGDGDGARTQSRKEKRITLLNGHKRRVRADYRTGSQGEAYCEVSMASDADAHGTSTSSVESTKVTAMATTEIVTPFIDRPNEGTLNIFVEYSPMASPGLSMSQRQEISQPILRTLERSIKETRTLDMESLCIVAGSRVWSVRVDIYILDDCGSILDACFLACMGALLNVRRPEVIISGDSVKVCSIEDRVPIPLSIHHVPIATSLIFVPSMSTTSVESGSAAVDNTNEDGNDANDGASTSLQKRPSAMQHRKQLCTLSTIRLVDPTEREEQVAVGKLVVVSNAHREVCGVYKSGAPGLFPDDLSSTIEAMLDLNAELCSLLRQQ